MNTPLTNSSVTLHVIIEMGTALLTEGDAHTGRAVSLSARCFDTPADALSALAEAPNDSAEATRMRWHHLHASRKGLSCRWFVPLALLAQYMAVSIRAALYPADVPVCIACRARSGDTAAPKATNMRQGAGVKADVERAVKDLQ